VCYSGTVWLELYRSTKPERIQMKNPLAGLANNPKTKNSNLRVTGMGTVVSNRSKKLKMSTALVKVGKKTHHLTLADVGALVMRDAEATVRQQIQENILRIAEHVIGRIQYWQGQIDKAKFTLNEFQRKANAIEAGEFTVNKFDGTVTFNDPTLERLG
jgi:hypothetical protein